jgi:hypothetical protein
MFHKKFIGGLGFGGVYPGVLIIAPTFFVIPVQTGIQDLQELQ